MKQSLITIALVSSSVLVFALVEAPAFATATDFGGRSVVGVHAVSWYVLFTEALPWLVAVVHQRVTRKPDSNP